MIRLSGRKGAIGEIWFREEDLPSDESLDLIIYRQLSTLPSWAKHYEIFSTLLFNLSLSEEELWAGIKKNASAKIRRSRDREGIIIKSYPQPDEAVLKEFVAFFNSFAEGKGLGTITIARMQDYTQTNNLVLRKAFGEKSGDVYVWHSYICAHGRARLFHSASQYRDNHDSGIRNTIGRANRYLHWDDMLWFKENNYQEYDLGGWYTGDSDSAKLAINQFKAEFGGTVTEEYNTSRALSLKGKLYLMMKRFKRR